MTTTSAIAPTPVIEPTWPTDVVEFARRQHIEGYLEPLRQASTQMFPNGSLRVYFSQDPEIDERQKIIFEMTVPKADIPEYVPAFHLWVEEKCRVCPSGPAYFFNLHLFETHE